MRPREHDAYEVNSNVTGKSQDLTVDINSVPHLMNLLSNLYSDPIMAVIREYSINAWDSHRAAGNSEPIKISLPTPLSATFRVEDSGVGMSEDDLLNIYSRYGASTKRDTDNEVGMLGLGCKSALTYTDQFAIRSVKDGVLINATIGRNVKGGGVLNIIGEPTPTKQRNGVKISIPVSDIAKFNEKAKWFFGWWESGSVLVDGNSPEPIGGIQVDSKFTMHTRANITTHALPNKQSGWYRNTYDVIIMGNIPYALTNQPLSQGLGNDTFISARVPIGTVDPVPSREQLHFTERTNQAVKDMKEEIHEAISLHIQEEIETVKTHAEALDVNLRWRKQLPFLNMKLEFEGEEVPNSFRVPSKGFQYTPFGDSAVLYGSEKYSAHKIDVLDLCGPSTSTVVVNFPSSRKVLSSRDRAKLRRWAEETDGVKKNLFLVFDQLPGLPWTSEVTVHDWEEVDKVKLDVGGKGVPKGLRFIPPTTADNRQRYGDAVNEMTDEMEKLLVSPAVEVSPFEVARIFKEAGVVILAKNRWDKFKRENKNVLTAEEKLRERIEGIDAKLPDAAFIATAGYPPFHIRFNRVDVKRVDDPKLRAYFKLHVETYEDKEVQKLTSEMRHLVMVYRQTINLKKNARNTPSKAYKALPTTIENRPRVSELAAYVKERYPLLTHSRHGKFDESFYEYVNAIHAVRTNIRNNKGKVAAA